MEGSGDPFVSVAAVDAFEVNSPLSWRRFSLSHDGYPQCPLYIVAQFDLSLGVASDRPRTCDQRHKGNGY
jgi:hypothetical protein